MFALKEFESFIPKKLLARGFAYFESQAVLNLEKTEQGQWEALVCGSEDYDVTVVLEGKQVKSWTCNCPYTDSSVCKHVVAVLYALRKTATTKIKKGQTSAKKMSFEDILQQVSFEELQAFIRFQKGQKKEFAEQFMLFFSDKDPRMDIEQKYRNLVNQLVRKHTDKGYMNYRSTFAFSKEMNQIMEAADNAIARSSFREAMIISQVVSKELLDTLSNSDDSAANISSIIEDAIVNLLQIAKSPTAAPEMQYEIFDWVEKSLQEPIWSEYGNFEHDLLDVAESIAPIVGATRFIGLLDRRYALEAARSSSLEYLRRQYTIRKTRFLQTIGRKEEAEQLIASNMDIADFRSIAVEKAIEQKDYIQAKQLITEGIEIAVSKNHPGTVQRWEKTLIRIAQLENDIPVFRFFSKRFAFNWGWNAEFYRQWKSSFLSEEWAEVIEQHIQAIIAEETNKQRKYAWENLETSIFRKLAPIFTEEGQWERLLQLIPSDPDQHILAQVHPHLAKRYPAEMLVFYLDLLTKMGDKVNDRGQYQALAALMEKVKQDIDGSRVPIDELAASLILKYPRRPAMRDELEKLLKNSHS